MTHAIFERDSARAWIVSVPSIPGCHTFGWSISQAKKRLEEVLRLWGADPRQVKTELRIGPNAQHAVAAAQRAREDADDAAEQARRTLAEAVIELEGFGYSRRDTATLLGISHQRVQQILDGG